MSTIYKPTLRDEKFRKIYTELREKEPFCNYLLIIDNDICTKTRMPREIEQEFRRQLNELMPEDENEMSRREKITRASLV